jgi:hypothetical protein
MTSVKAETNGGPSVPALPSLGPLLAQSQRMTQRIFADQATPISSFSSSTASTSSDAYESITKTRLSSKINSEYKDAQQLPQALLAQQGNIGPARPGRVQLVRRGKPMDLLPLPKATLMIWKGVGVAKEEAWQTEVQLRPVLRLVW